MSDWKKLVEVSTALMESRDYKRTLGIIVEQLASLSGARRACVVIENMEGKFVVKAGYPAEGHGIDTILTPTNGEEFLREIIENGEIEIIDDPKEDPRTSYMRQMAWNYDITKIMFLPLAYQGDALGALVLDFCNGQSENELPVYQIQFLANLAASAIGSEYARRRAKEKMRRMERMYAIGEESARIAHIFGNAITATTPFIRRAHKKVQELEGEQVGQIVVSLNAAIEEMEGVERVVKGILQFSKPGTLHLDALNINTFIKERVARVSGDIPIEYELDGVLELVGVSFDPELMGHAVSDLVINATQAEGTTVIRVKTSYSRKKGLVRVEITNNGEEIELGLVDDIFSPFVTTKSRGTGLGLANVKSILAAHGGDVRLTNNEKGKVTFELSLLQ